MRSIVSLRRSGGSLASLLRTTCTTPTVCLYILPRPQVDAAQYPSPK